MQGALIDIGLPLVLAFVMVGIGLTLQVDDFARQRRQPLPAIIGVLGWAIGVPLIGFLVVAVFHLSTPLAVGLILVAATSGGTTSKRHGVPRARQRRAGPGTHGGHRAAVDRDPAVLGRVGVATVA